jgi:MFS family permease
MMCNDAHPRATLQETRLARCRLALLVAASVRTNPPLRRLLAAWAQSCLGTGAGYVALLLLTYSRLHSSWAVMAVLLADFLPAIAFGSWFGGLADRYPKRPLIVAANVVQGGAFVALAFSHTAAPILSLALLAGVGNALQRPALRSSLPLVAGESQQQLAAALYDACRWIGIAIGPAIAAALFAVAGVALPLAINGISFFIAAAVMATIAVGRPPAAEEEPGTQPPAGVLAGLREAFAAPGIATVVACSAGSVIAGGLLNVCEPFLARRVLHGSGSDYALLVTCYGLGMVLASGLVARRGDAAPRVLVRRYLAALALTAAGMAGSAIVGSVLPAAIAFAATGYANALLLVSETQLIQLRVPAAVQGRLFGAKDTVEGAAFLIGLLAAGALVATGGVRMTLALGAGVCGICALAAIAALRRSAFGRAAALELPDHSWSPVGGDVQATEVAPPPLADPPPLGGLIEVETEIR